MKKVITICLLAGALLACGMTMEAKTTKKKSKATSSQTSKSNSNALSVKEQMLGVLKKYRNKDTEGYFITDINNDGRPELWIDCTVDYSTNGHKDIYFFDKSGVLKKDVIQTGRRANDLCNKDGKLYLVYEDEIYEISFQNNKFHKNLILQFEYDWEGEPKSFTKGSKQLLRSFEDQPMIEFCPITDPTLINNYFK